MSITFTPCNVQGMETPLRKLSTSSASEGGPCHHCYWVSWYTHSRIIPSPVTISALCSFLVHWALGSVSLDES
jgi:hypothetical protein